MRPEGLVTVSRIVDSTGKVIPIEDAIRYGWLPREVEPVPPGWGVGRDEACLGRNLYTDQGRQLLAYAFAFRSPIQNFVCSKFGVGTGTASANASDVALEAPVALASGSLVGSVDSIDFLSAFVVRIAFTLGLADCNGSLLTEQGLFSGNDSLIARRVRTVGIAKDSTFSPSFTWRVRF